MKFRYMSDLHLEFYSPDHEVLSIPSHEDDHESTLILAGDIGVISKARTIKPFLLSVSKQFAHVVIVPGNHEYYNGCISNGVIMLRDFVKDVSNIHVLDDNSVVIDDVKVIGATMWTDFNKNDPIIKTMALTFMEDYNLIKYIDDKGKWSRITPDLIYKRHVDSVDYIVRELTNEQGKVVVVTHHMPSFLSVHTKYAGQKSNFFFASELYELICTFKPKVWVHGHTHDSMDYMIEETKVLCNPKGYPLSYDLNSFFDINKFFIV